MQLSIRPWTEADASVIAEALNDAGVTDNLRDGLPTPYTEADARDYIAFAQTAGEGAYAFAIAEDGVAVGSIQLTRQQNIHRRTAELGYYVVRRRWGAAFRNGRGWRYVNIIGDRERYDREKVLKFIGLVMWAFAVSMGGLWLLAGLFDSFALFYAGLIASLAVAIFTLVYMNTGARFLKK